MAWHMVHTVAQSLPERIDFMQLRQSSDGRGTFELHIDAAHTS
jgi:hypothetical protein